MTRDMINGMNYAKKEHWYPVQGPYGLPYEWRDKAVLYWREEWEAPQALRMGDQCPQFDVSGLYYFGGRTRARMQAEAQAVSNSQQLSSLALSRHEGLQAAFEMRHHI